MIIKGPVKKPGLLILCVNSIETTARPSDNLHRERVELKAAFNTLICIAKQGVNIKNLTKSSKIGWISGSYQRVYNILLVAILIDN